MTQSQHNYMGEFLKEKPRLTAHTVLNYFLTRPVKFQPNTALIVKEVQFPDVSFYQKEIDYDILATKTDAIILRAGQGAWPDSQFERNYREAKGRGLLVGVYWFYDGRYSPGDQASLLISLLQGKQIDLEVFIDWEHNYGGRWEGLSNVVAMMQAVEFVGLKIKDVGMYTGYYFFRANSNPITNASQYSYLKTKPLWLAWYTQDSSIVLIPAPWTALTHWQWGTPVVYWGQATSELDMNFFNGSVQEFHFRYGAIPMAYNYEVTPYYTNGCKIRNGHSVSSVQIGSLTYGKKAWGNERWGDGITEDWIRIAEYQNNQGGITMLDGWIAVKSGGSKYAVLAVLTPPPPEPDVPTLTHTIEVYSDGSITVDGEPYP